MDLRESSNKDKFKLGRIIMKTQRTTGIVCLLAVAVSLMGCMLHLQADQIKLNTALARPILPSGKKQTDYLKVSLTGFSLPAKIKRTPVNVAIVIDRSGSMSGEKIARARDAAIQAVNRLNSNDIVSIITYESTVNVLVPATKLSDKSSVIEAIRKITPAGSTALFAGVSKGAEEVKKFLAKNRVNRIILLSDGLANVGPSTPSELGALGASLARENISVSTIGLGLGYNEDLMTQLAMKSDGNHAFVENAADLVRIFNREFDDVLSVVAQEISITIKCAPGIRPVRVLGREAEISGQNVVTSMNQLYGGQEKYVLLEIEVPAGEADKTRNVATVNISYANMITKTTDKLQSSLAVRYTNSETAVAKAKNKKVIESAVIQIATKNNEEAMKLRDQGKINEAKKKLESNVRYMKKYAPASAAVREYQRTNAAQAEDISSNAKWNRTRKSMRKDQYLNQKQQSY